MIIVFAMPRLASNDDEHSPAPGQADSGDLFLGGQGELSNMRSRYFD